MPSKRKAHVRKRPRGCGRTLLLAALLLGLLGYLGMPYLRSFMPIPEWLPLRVLGVQTFGLDLSHYQGEVRWAEVAQSSRRVHYVFLRASMGRDGIDQQFQRNWTEAGRYGLLRGAYHYFRPNEDPAEQFANFKAAVVLQPGDLPPVLDVEELGENSPDQLRKAVGVWVRLAEEHYGVKPVLYSGRNFYREYLEGHFPDCPLWIAAYSGKKRLKSIPWSFHQFTERAMVSGIDGFVDGNDFNGDLEVLEEITLK